ncbi:MAG: hypothetical protein R3Y65_03435 [Bacillota bacterium]
MGEFKKFCRHNKIITTILGIVCIGLVFLYVAIGETLEGAIILVSIGILTSLVTSLFFSWTVKNESADSLKEICKEIKSNDEKIGRMAEAIESYHKQIVDNAALREFGVLSIREKVCPENKGKYWIDLLASANDEFAVLGKTINTWFNEMYKEAFVDKILQMTKNNKVVKIVLQGPTYNNLKTQNMSVDDKKMLNTYRNLASIYGDIPNQNKQCLQVHVLDVESKVCYAYIKTDKSCYVSTYMFDHENEAKSFWIEFDNKSSFTGMFGTDFNNMITEENKIDLGVIYANTKKNSN